MSLNHTSEFSDLTESQYAALGKVVVEWANMEFLLGVLLGRLLVTPDFHARTFVNSISAAKIQSAIDEALQIQEKRYKCKIIEKEIVDDLTKINKEITALRASRNKVAHFCWCRSDDDLIWGTRFGSGIPSPQKEKKNSNYFSVSELKALHQSTYKLVDDLEKIIQKLPKFKESNLLAALAIKVEV